MECESGCHSGDYHYLIVGLSECRALLPPGTSVCFRTKISGKSEALLQNELDLPSSITRGGTVARFWAGLGAGQVWVLGHGTAHHPPRSLEAKFMVSSCGLIYLVGAET